MNKKKLLAIAVTVLAILMIIPFAASAEEPVKDGWYTDKGYYEYFEDGNQYADGVYWIDEYQSFFRFDENGKMYNNQWYRDSEGYYYYYQSGGYQATDEILYINGAYYGFDSSGMMFADCTFQLYSSEMDEIYYYTATPSGALISNKWVWVESEYYEKGGYWLYYKEGGKQCCDEIAKVGNSYYYFDYSGAMLNDTFAEVWDNNTESYRYVRAKNGGVLYRNEWYKSPDGLWYYYGSDCYAAQGYTKVGNTYYFFYADGEMVANTTLFDGANSYFVDKNGIAKKLNANGWTNLGGKWYYCTDGEIIRNEIVLIGNAYYYFDWEGIMLDDADDSFYDDEINFPRYIRAKKGGALYCGEWYQTPDENFIYFGYDCFTTVSGFLTIGEKLYYFEDSYAVKNQIVETGSAVYFAKSDCSLEIKPNNSWINVNGDFYYVSNDQLARNCILDIAGSKYVFDDSGRMQLDGVAEIWIEEDLENDIYGGYYYFLLAKDGKIITNTGWYAYDGSWYYINADHTLYTGYLNIGGTKYGLWPQMDYASFDYDWEYDVYGEHLYLYLVAPDGKYQQVTKDGYYITNYGKMLVENGKIFMGWKNISGKWYYFEPAMVCGRVCEIYENETSDIYYFDDTGAMLSNGWIPYENAYLYADTYGRLANGITFIGNKNYLFKNHELAYDTYLVTEEGIYVTDANGVATLLQSGDGWKQANGYWYYVKYGILAQGRTTIIENGNPVEYYFDYNTRRMKTNTLVDEYYCDAYGRLFTGWKQIDGDWYYFGPSKYNYGRYTIDNKDYYFDETGRMICNTTYYSRSWDMIFVIDAYGIIVDEYDVPNNIIYQDGRAYLYKDGKAYQGWYGENYFRDGVMLISQTVNDNGKWYYLDKHGKYIRNGWYQDSYGDWLYANAYGAICHNEWLQLGSTWYYFDGEWMVSNGVHYIEKEDKYAEFDKYGRFVKYVSEDESNKTSKANTWELKNGKWYYYNSTGSMVKDETLYLGNAWYTFDSEGIMLTNYLGYSYYSDNFYYYSASGARINASNEWKLIDGKWYYFNSDSSISWGWINVNGTQYYTDVIYNIDKNLSNITFELNLLTGYQNIDGKIYYFDASGACKGEYVGNGWLQLKNGDFVYFKNGELLKDGIYTIGNTKYYFHPNGIMLANNWTFSMSGKLLYASATGALYGTGWHNTTNGWIYIDANGNLLANGVYKIGNGIYFFEDGYWVA